MTEPKSQNTRLNRFMSSWRKRPVRVIIGTVVLLGFAAYQLVPTIVSPATMTDRLKQEMTAWLGVPVTISGETSVSFWPRPSITVTGVAAPEPGGSGPFIYGSIQSFSANFNIVRALSGGAGFSNFVLQSPTIIFQEKADEGAPPQSTLAKAVAESGENGNSSARFAGPNSVDLIDGTLGLVRDDGTRVVKGLNGTLSWPNLQKSLSFSGTATLNGTITDISFTADKPLQLLDDHPSQLSLEIANNAVQMSYLGTATRELPHLLDGKLSLSTTDTRSLHSWTDLPLQVFENASTAALQGTVTRSGSSLRFSPASLTIAGSKGDGVVDIAQDENGQPSKMMATLAFGDVALPNLQASLPAWIDAVSANAAGDQTTPLTALDLRLSARSVQLSDIKLNDVAASIMRSKQQASFDIADSTYGNGTLFAHIGVQNNNTADVDIAAKNVQAGPLFRQMGFNVPLETSTLDLNLNFEARLPLGGLTADDASGTISFSAGKGTVSWLDFASLLDKAKSSDAFALTFAGDKVFNFDRISGSGTLEGENLSLSQLTIISGPDRIDITGDIDTRSGQIDVEVALSKTGDETVEPVTFALDGNALASLVRRVENPVTEE